MTDYSGMDDPAFLAERKRVRDTIEALQAEYEALTEEFDRRASAAWTNYPGHTRAKLQANR